MRSSQALHVMLITPYLLHLCAMFVLDVSQQQVPAHMDLSDRLVLCVDPRSTTISTSNKLNIYAIKLQS